MMGARGPQDKRILAMAEKLRKTPEFKASMAALSRVLCHPELTKAVQELEKKTDGR